ncbi:glycosyltransferase family 2 protein [Tychonema sp. LEGE 07199]|uniref:glycosyltransferase family 2 protein n=1 Tax=unclassified Tychonema TaxID=2642144 RepID=UPI0018826AF9|nr:MULTISPECIES: glycosyltransferase family 2 protein [unclassified Tychonema]MBE9120967.1 glycosyltransferase family 2 protein [Tychonema sp. LEGE 07199]MBE9131096.1 glycosyltransferase family 2 protein [Tychonema sp. LEGE 07196]
MSKDLSFVIPVHNEEATIKLLFEKIQIVMSQVEIDSYEVIFIDDGSRDASWREIADLASQNPKFIKAIKMRRNFGKSAALSAGFRNAAGRIIFTLDADLQDDPAEIPKFLESLKSGFDLVSGWRKQRNDPLSKTLPSKLFNAVACLLTGVKMHDMNCGFKAYRREVLHSIKLYGELHRYIPALANNLGFKIGEVVVEHHPRKHGKSNYGWERYARGFIDLLTVLATTHYLHKPGHLFGGLGLSFGLVGTVSLSYLIVIWFLNLAGMNLGPIGNRPLLFFGILCTILSVQLISLGILAELIARNVAADYVDKQICEIIDDSGFDV